MEQVHGRVEILTACISLETTGISRNLWVIVVLSLPSSLALKRLPPVAGIVPMASGDGGHTP
jgi:hypothetical protein